MNPAEWGLGILAALLVLLLLGVPVAFALGAVATAALLLAGGTAMMGILAETMFGGLAEFGLAAVPMFILMGAAVASSPAGSDLYEALDRWLHRVPGGLALSNIGACSVFAALSGSSPATCAAIGKIGVPEMVGRGYPPSLAAGAVAAGGTLGILIPPSVTMIVYGIATETSIGRLFIAGILPGLMLVGLFMLWTLFVCVRSGHLRAAAASFGWRERLAALPRVVPFLLVVAGVLFALYGGVATPSEAAGMGAALCLVLVAVVYKMARAAPMLAIFRSAIRESVMIMMIIGAAELFSFALSFLFITQTAAEWIAAQELGRWGLMLIINVFLLVAGFFLPPVAVILMTAPILLPIVMQAGFDPYWFAVMLTINMEIGLITPPVGLNLFVIRSVAPGIQMRSILLGSLPFVLCMVVGIILLCIFPGIATWLPERLMGPPL